MRYYRVNLCINQIINQLLPCLWQIGKSPVKLFLFWSRMLTLLLLLLLIIPAHLKLAIEQLYIIRTSTQQTTKQQTTKLLFPHHANITKQRKTKSKYLKLP